MNNKSKKVQTITTTLSSLAITLIFVMTPPVYAHDSNSSILNLAPFGTTDTTHDLYYDISDLDKVTLDGASNGAGLRLLGEVGRAAIDTTDFTLTEDTTLDYGDSRLDARYYSSTNYYGQTSPHGSGSNYYKVIWLNTNDNLDYKTSNACTTPWNEPNPRYIIMHEFGHWAGLSHHSSWPFNDTHTAMKGGCNPGQYDLRTEDKNDINDYYG